MNWRTDLANAPRDGTVIETQCVSEGQELPTRRAVWGALGRFPVRTGWVREDRKFWVPTPTRWRPSKRSRDLCSAFGCMVGE